MAQHQIGVGDGGLGAAAAVTGRAGPGAGAAWTDLQGAAGAQMRDGAATGAQCHDVQALQRDAFAGHLPAPAQRGLAAGDQRDVGGGAAHVEGHQLRPHAGRGERHSGRDTARGAGQRGADRQPRRVLQRCHAAMAQDDEDRAGIARAGQPLAQPAEVAGDDGADIGVHRGGGEALELLDFRQHLAGGGDEHAGHGGAHRGCGLRLVPAVAPGMQEADRNRLGAVGGGDGGGQGCGVERDLHLAVGAQPLAHAVAAVARHQRFGRRHAQVVALRLQPLAHLHHVAVALRGEHGNARAAALQQRVGGDGGAVDDALGAGQQCGQGNSRGGGQVGQAGQHTFGLVGRRAGGLGQKAGAVRGDAHNVGEGAADVDADAPHQMKPSAASLAVAAGLRFAGSPQPPPPADCRYSTSPGLIGTPTSLVRSTRSLPSAPSST